MEWLCGMEAMTSFIKYDLRNNYQVDPGIYCIIIEFGVVE